MSTSAEHQRRHRARLRQQGKTEVLLKLPVEAVAILDRLRESQGVASRGDVVVSLIQRATEAENALTQA
jgi:hypothetical protein